MKKSSFLGVGSYLPARVVSNYDLPKNLDTSDEWIVKRTGIKQRHIAASGELTSDMAVIAAQRALEDAKISANNIDLIIVATTTPDRTFPGCATMVQERLGCKKAYAFDVQAVCSGFIYALDVADSFVKAGKVSTVLVIGAEVMSGIVDWADRGTCILFGDGAGAVVLQAVSSDTCGIISSHLYSDGSLQSILYTDGGVALNNKSGKICMNGPVVFEYAVEKLTSVIAETLSYNNLKLDDIDWVVPHQANVRIIKSVATRLGLPWEKMIVTVDTHANTSAASIPLALDSAKSSGKLKRGDLVLLAAIGGGMTWGTVLFCY